MTDQTTDTQATETPVQLQLQDLLLSAQVIQLASQRGAIKAEEMEAVGGLYNRIVTFLQVSGAIAPVANPDETPSDTTTAPAAE